MSLTNEQEQKLLASLGRVEDLELEIASLKKYINTLEKKANDYTNRLVPIALKSNTETLTGAKTLLNTDFVIQYLDPGGAGRTITLPAEAERNHCFIIVNTADAAETITVENIATTTVATIPQSKQAILISDGTTWKVFDTSTASGDIFLKNTSDTMHGSLIIDNTSVEALNVRKNSDGGDIFIVDTTNSDVNLKQLTFIDGGSSVDIVRDEDNMATDDANALATQQSIKKYVDDNISGTTMYVGTFTGDGNASQAITSVGGTPKHLIIWESVADDSSGDRWETTTNMIDNDPQGLAYTINDSGNVSMQDGAIVSLDADGFTVGLLGGSPNANGQVNEFVAYF